VYRNKCGTIVDLPKGSNITSGLLTVGIYDLANASDDRNPKVVSATVIMTIDPIIIAQCPNLIPSGTGKQI